MNRLKKEIKKTGNRGLQKKFNQWKLDRAIEKAAFLYSWIKENGEEGLGEHDVKRMRGLLSGQLAFTGIRYSKDDIEKAFEIIKRGIKEHNERQQKREKMI